MKQEEHTPSVGGSSGSNNSTGQTGSNTQIGGGGASSAGTPVSGFYFLHRDYLDSVTMITDGRGEMVSGMDLATGKSVVDYKPYGEIDRKNSDGPDIFRYKYTGQEEDRETGLYYYKARYYDPEIGRFIQPDTEINMNSTFGMNLYMYVEGNPIMYSDPSGHRRWYQGGRRYTGMNAKLRYAGTSMGNGLKVLLGQKVRRHNGKRIDLGKAFDRGITFRWNVTAGNAGGEANANKQFILFFCGIQGKEYDETTKSCKENGTTTTGPNNGSGGGDKIINSPSSLIPIIIGPERGSNGLPFMPSPTTNIYGGTDDGYQISPGGHQVAGIENTLINSSFFSDYDDPFKTSVFARVVVRYNVIAYPWDICIYQNSRCSYNGGSLFLGLNTAGEIVSNKFMYHAFSYKVDGDNKIKQILRAIPELWDGIYGIGR